MGLCFEIGMSIASHNPIPISINRPNECENLS